MDQPTRETPRRKAFRFKPDIGTLAYVAYDNGGEEVRLEVPALVLDESSGGCSLVVRLPGLARDVDLPHVPIAPTAGDIWWVKIGKLESVRAEIRRSESLDEDLVKVGLMYLRDA